MTTNHRAFRMACQFAEVLAGTCLGIAIVTMIMAVLSLYGAVILNVVFGANLRISP